MAESIYTSGQFTSISLLAKIPEGSFSVLGFYFVLRDILKDKNGVIDLKALASSLGIPMMRIYSFVGILEDALIIRTTATPNGRYIDFLGIPEPEQKISLPAQDCMKYLMNYLNSCGIAPGKSASYEDINPYIIKTADFIGDKFQKVRDFYSALKSTLNDCREFTYILPSTNDIGTFNMIITLARSMRTLDLLSVYEYVKTPERLLKLQAAQTPEARSFISGGWLEHYVHSKAVSILTGEYACVRNLNVTLPENEQFEFDMLICTGENVIWVECKSGRYSPYLAKYSRIAKLLGLDAKNVIMVTAETQAINTVPDYGITSCSLEDFPETFRKVCT